VVHCHDLLALRSALGDIPENPIRTFGKIYQRFIRWGFRHAQHFICNSEKTREDLYRFGRVRATTCDVVNNGFSEAFARLDLETACTVLLNSGYPAEMRGMILHVGGGFWYKNAVGVVRIYAKYAAGQDSPLSLWMISPSPEGKLADEVKAVRPPGRIFFFQDLKHDDLQAAYSLARVLLFPSLAEGFGWPIAEAQACGCLVLTTGEPPMTEVGGPAACYLPRLKSGEEIDTWASAGAFRLQELVSLDGVERDKLETMGAANSKRFDTRVALDSYLAIYENVIRWSARDVKT